jgi:glycosyltransferase involved in cell wall biosynthesis
MASSLGPRVEVVVVDGGSTDSTLDVLQRYVGSSFFRLKVIRDGGSNAGESRNVGLRNASGKYVIFLDSDDQFTPGALRWLFRAAEKNGPDIISFGGYLDSGLQPLRAAPWFIRVPEDKQGVVLRPSELGLAMFEFSPPAPWLRFYNRNFLLENNLQFQSLESANDVFFFVTSVARCKSLLVVKRNLVCYKMGAHSSTTARFEENWANPANAVLEARRFLAGEMKNSRQLQRAFWKFAWGQMFFRERSLSPSEFKIFRRALAVTGKNLLGMGLSDIMSTPTLGLRLRFLTLNLRLPRRVLRMIDWSSRKFAKVLGPR